MKALLLALVLGGALALVAYAALSDWDASGMSLHMWIALGLGTVFSLLVGVGLMALVFYSARHGYDERADFRPADNDD